MPLGRLTLLQAGLESCSEIVISLSSTPPEELLSIIASRRNPNQHVTVLVRENFPDLALLRRLHLLGFRVDVCWDLPEENILFLNRNIGVTLPDGEEVAEAFSLCCRLLWLRFGRFVSLDGIIGQVSEDGTFFSLVKGGYPIWVSLKPTAGCGELLPGRKVSVFGFCIFMVNIVEAWEIRREMEHSAEGEGKE